MEQLRQQASDFATEFKKCVSSIPFILTMLLGRSKARPSEIAISVSVALALPIGYVIFWMEHPWWASIGLALFLATYLFD